MVVVFGTTNGERTYSYNLCITNMVEMVKHVLCIFQTSITLRQ